MTALKDMLPDDWKIAIAPWYDINKLDEIDIFLNQEIQKGNQVFPPRDKIFAALHATPVSQVKAVLLGQDPYHDDHQAMGLAFAVPNGIKTPPSLKNILAELAGDTNQLFLNSDISTWSQRGVLMLNTVLTVRAHQPMSHRKIGWEEFTDAIIRTVAKSIRPAVFILWGNEAQKKLPLIEGTDNDILIGVHPSPLSAHRGFFGSRPFSEVNKLLKKRGLEPIDWSI